MSRKQKPSRLSSPIWTGWFQNLHQELDPREQEARRVLLSDLRIQTKAQTLVELTPNAVQEVYLDDLCPRWREGIIHIQGLREIILKARQFGFSTLIAALFFLITINTPNTTTLVVAHDAETTEELFQMVHRFYQNLPDHKRPKTKYNSRRQLFWPSLNSRFLVRTASGKGGGRGLTVHNLHCSEAAFYTNRKLFTALLQSVPKTGNVFVESTANGEVGDGEVYHKEYHRSKEDPDSPFTARFYAWWQHEEYETQPGLGFTRTDDEQSITQRYDLDKRFGRDRTDRKLAWRRSKKAEPGMGNLFAQEYPGDDKEAFLVSGSRYFTEWSDEKHVKLQSEVSIERHWPAFGAYDWGHAKPACFELGRIDARGRVLIVDEEYNADLTDPEQAQKVLECLQRNGLNPADVDIWADPAMWALKTDTVGKKVANVKAFHELGLRFKKASNDRIGGWMNVRRYLKDEDKPDPNLPAVPFLRILRGKCPNLIRTMPLQIHDERDPEDMETDADTVEDHPPDTLRYLLASKPRPSGPDPNAKAAASMPFGKRHQPQKTRKL